MENIRSDFRGFIFRASFYNYNPGLSLKEASREKNKSVIATSTQNLATSSEVCAGCARRKIDGVYVPSQEADLPLSGGHD